MSELLYLKDCYLRTFQATVVRADGRLVILDKTGFYVEGGGQPADTGMMQRGDEIFRVQAVRKTSGEIMHDVDHEGLRAGDIVSCEVDWGVRYRYMRYHTACHLLSGLIHRDTGALITGNQIKPHESRIDFDLETMDRALLDKVLAEANGIILQNVPVAIKFMPRDEALKIPAIIKLKMFLPVGIEEVRVIEIGDADVQACGGTHLKSTHEIGKIVLNKVENKGKNN
ncbi:alanyl-tRNA editing protein, partial [Candidatus Woesearchaeota archaeon]|nr:alanyl-tRNA editing protein [Candidatus Woesearchaeota archaeon]